MPHNTVTVCHMEADIKVATRLSRYLTKCFNPAPKVVFHRPYAKLRIIQAIENEIKQAIQPLLSTATLKNSDLLIAKMD